MPSSRRNIQGPRCPGIDLYQPSKRPRGFTPSPQTFAANAEQMALTRNELAAAVEHGDLAAGTDVDEALRMLTVLVVGRDFSQQARF